jgi:hypothetical protein
MNLVSSKIRGAFRQLLFAAALLVGLVGCEIKKNPERPATASVEQPALRVTSYSTSFKLNENPLSEDGRWIGGKTVGMDWGDVSSSPGYAVGLAGPKEYADAVALLTGDWSPNQTVEAVVDKRNVTRYPEVSLRLRSTVRKHECNGYEISRRQKRLSHHRAMEWSPG